MGQRCSILFRFLEKKLTTARPKKPKVATVVPKKRPDPYFKSLMREIIARNGLVTGETALSQAMDADLLVIVPLLEKIQKTFLYFLLFHNVVEFKSQNDALDWQEYCNAISRAMRYAAQSKVPPHLVLNLIVTARKPESLIAYLAEHGGELTQSEEAGKGWLWQGQCGPQKIIVIVCRDLPLQAEWYEWLAFAPSDSKTWRDFVFKMLYEDNERILQILQDLRPEEFEVAKSLMDELIEKGEIPQREVRRIERGRVRAAQIALTDFTKRRRERLEETLSVLSPEDRLIGLSPEDRLAGMTAEERQELRKLLAEAGSENSE